MSFLDKLISKLQRHPKRIVFPEGSDPRIIQAARQIVTQKLGVPMLVGDRTAIKEIASKLDIRLDHIRIIEPARSSDLDLFKDHLRSLKRFRDVDEDKLQSLLLNNNYFASLMLATDRAEALISGATSAASSGLRSLFQIIPPMQFVKNASSLQILDVDNDRIGMQGLLFLGDCAVIPTPSAEQLSDIAITTAGIAFHLTNEKPRVAMLSYTTKSTKSKDPAIAKVKEATRLAREKAKQLGVEMEIDGEMQVDAALDPGSASSKNTEGSRVAGRANVLIFPDLNSGNIASKMVNIVAGGCVYGQIITGLSKPCAEISRGASARDIFGTATIVACQAVDHRFLYGKETPDED